MATAFDREELEEIKFAAYRELQSGLRAMGLPASGKAEVLRERLLEAVQARQAKDAKKQAKAAAKLPLDEGLASPRSPPGTSRRHRSLSSLQDGAKEKVTEVAGQAADVAAEVAHVVKEAAAAGAEDLKVAWEAAAEHIAPVEEPAAETIAAAANWTSDVWSRVKAGFARWLPAGDLPRLPLLLVFLLGAALGVGLTMLAHPHAWHDLRQQTNDAASRASSGAGSMYRTVSETFLEAFPRGQWARQCLPAARYLMPGLLPAAQGHDSAMPLHCRMAVWTTALPALLPPPDGPWAGLSADLRALSDPGGAPLHKGLGLLLACETAQQCAAAVEGFRLRIPAPCANCLLHITEEQLAQGRAEARGALQRTLVDTLRRWPHAVVIVDAATLAAAPAAALPPLINALSERGHFQDAGTQVSTTQALYIVTMTAPEEIMAAAGDDEDAFKSAAKAHFVELLSSASGGQARGLAEVLRRRLDYAAPVGGHR